MVENVVIIGGGPAGLSAAIYTARAGLSPIVFAGSPPGGQLTLTSEIENFPGHDSIAGFELIEKMRSQAKKFGARIVDENIVKINISKKPFEIIVTTPNFLSSSGNPPPSGESQVAKNLSPSSYLTKTIIIATGAKPRFLGLESEKKLLGRGVSVCATCDGFFFKNKVVALVGGGDVALEEALTLTKFASKVYIIHRRDKFRASNIMQDRVMKNPKIEVIFNTVVEKIIGINKVEEIRLKSVSPLASQSESVKSVNTDSTDSTDNLLKIDGLFIAIGRMPDTEIFKNQVETDEKGYIVTSMKQALELVKSVNPDLTDLTDSNRFNYLSMTSVSGVFAAGDCVDSDYRQAIVAAGMGAEAGMDAVKWLESSA